MRRSFYEKQKTDKGSLAISILVNAVLIAVIGSITFTYEFGGLFPPRTPDRSERVQYIVPQPRQAPAAAAPAAGETKKKQPKKTEIPLQLIPPTTIPTTLPPIPPPTASTGATSGTATGAGGVAGGVPGGVAAGVTPALPDPRLELRPNNLRLPLTQAEKNDSAVRAIYMAYREAAVAAEESRGRSPRDWTVERGGQKYGLDSQWVYLGKFKIPSAILAALPLNYAGVDGHRIIENRNASWIQQDIYEHSQGLSEDDFRAAVRRIRERKEREKKEADERAGRASPIVP